VIGVQSASPAAEPDTSTPRISADPAIATWSVGRIDSSTASRASGAAGRSPARAGSASSNTRRWPGALNDPAISGVRKRRPSASRTTRLALKPVVSGGTGVPGSPGPA
jgi:hypothetical protein